MEIPEELAEAAHEHKMAAGRDAAVDELTTAIMTGASPVEISRLEASAAHRSREGVEAATDPDDGLDYEQGDPNACAGREAGDLPPNEPRNAERIRLTGLEERDKGLVNAANIIAKTERIPFDEAWRRVVGDSSQAQAGYEAQDDGAAHGDEHSQEALSQHHLQAARELYADLANPESAHWREAHRIATDPSHPDHDPDIVARPNAAMIVAKLAAANVGIGGNDRNSINQPRGRVRPAAATKQSAPPPARKSNPEIVRASEQAALDAIEGNMPPMQRQAPRAYLRL